MISLKKKRRLKKKVIFFLLAIFVILLILFSLGLQNRNPKEAKKKEKKEIEQKEEVYQSNIPKLRTLYQNEDIIAELRIPSLNLTEILVKGQDNDYYLTHDLEKNEKEQGSSFLDYRTLDIDTAKQLNVYGHNSPKKDLPFSVLESYQEEGFLEEHDLLLLNTEKNSYSYKIFAVTTVPKAYDEHMIIAYQGQKFLEHVQKMRANAIFDTQEEIQEEDSILVLQTCLFNPEEFLLLLAKKVAP